MANAKKIDRTQARGKHVHSADPRKAAVVAALKAASGCRKVTTVQEVTSVREGSLTPFVDTFTGNCMNPNNAESVPGFWQVELERK